MELIASRVAGIERLKQFLPRSGISYAETRNFDDGAPVDGFRQNVSQLSPWLHAGLLSESEVISAVLGQHSAQAADKFVAEIFWRVYFKGYLEQRPSIWVEYLAERDAAHSALENTDQAEPYQTAVEGRTGIAAFDHWARELVRTGYLHNHARMWFASIWIFTLRLDWQLGADFFLQHLIDADAASNTLSWRWVGGLHTKGKTYLARPDNIARYTVNQLGGPLSAEGLASEAVALEEVCEHPRMPLDLPSKPARKVFDAPFALLLHDEAASHDPLGLPASPNLVIGVSNPERRSLNTTGEPARKFAHSAIEGGMASAAEAFECQAREWDGMGDLSTILDQAGIDRLVLPHLPTGWTRDALLPALMPLIEQGRIIPILSELDRTTWPLAKAGFFGVKKQIENVLQELGIIDRDCLV